MREACIVESQVAESEQAKAEIPEYVFRRVSMLGVLPIFQEALSTNGWSMARRPRRTPCGTPSPHTAQRRTGRFADTVAAAARKVELTLSRLDL